MKEIHREILERLKKEFPSGTRELLFVKWTTPPTLKAGDNEQLRELMILVQFMLTGIRKFSWHSFWRRYLQKNYKIK